MSESNNFIEKLVFWLVIAIKYIFIWIIAAVLTTSIAIIFQTQNVIARLVQIGGEVGFVERLSMTFYDVIHLGTLYGLFIAIALFVAFPAGGLLFRFTKFGRPIIYMVAGGVAILVMLFSMKQAFFGIHMIAGARDFIGISFQVLAGIIGGLVFARLSQNLRQPKKNPAQGEA